MAPPVTVISIDDDIRILKGSWPALSVCAQKGRDTGEDLCAQVKELSIGKLRPNGSSCVLMISRRDMVLKILDIPSQDPQEIDRMLALQIPSVVPFDGTQIMCRHRVLSVHESGSSTVIAAVVPEHVIQESIDALSGAGWTVSGACTAFDGEANYVRWFLKEPGSGSSRSALIFSGDHDSTILVCSNGALEFSYRFACGRADVRDNVAAFVEALARSLAMCERFCGREIGRVCLDRSFQDFEEIVSRLAEERGGMIETIDIFSGLPESCRVFAEKNGMDISWMPIVGCLAGCGDFAFMNFLPKKVYFSNIRKKGRRRVLSFVGGLVSVIVLSAAVFQAAIFRSARRLETLKTEAAVLEPRLKEMRAEDDFFEIMTRRNRNRDSVLEMIREVCRILPEGVALQHFSMGEDGAFELKGVSDDFGLNHLQSALVALEDVRNVNLKYATKRRRFDKEYTEFQFIFDRTDR